MCSVRQAARWPRGGIDLAQVVPVGSLTSTSAGSSGPPPEDGRRQPPGNLWGPSSTGPESRSVPKAEVVDALGHAWPSCCRPAQLTIAVAAKLVDR